MKCRLEIDTQVVVKKRGFGIGGQVQRYVDSEVLRLCEPYVPRDSTALIRSGTNNTNIGSGKVIYNTPYARKWYYTEAHFQGAPKRGTRWFERMKNEGGAMSILQGVARIVGGTTKV